MRPRTKARLIMVAAVLLLIGVVAGTIWQMIEIDRCYDNGGIVVGALMREQQCVMPKTDTSSSRP